MQASKPWYQSQTIIGAGVAALASALKIAGIETSDLLNPQTADQILNAVSLAGTIVAIFGRIHARKAIRGTEAPPPIDHKTIGTPIVLALLVPLFSLGLTSCAQGPVYPGSAAARVATDVEVAAVQALQAYADFQSGNVDMVWALSKGVNAYAQVVQEAGDIKLLAKAWTGNTGDSQKLADKLARIFAASAAPPAQKAAAIAKAAETVAARAGG